MAEATTATMSRSVAAGELSAGYKLVPWSSWSQWNFVRESIFSSSPDDVAAALRRISAWRSRGTLPVPIDVTAAFIEIQQKDPFFRKDAGHGMLESEEMLSMLYSMAIIRLVNCFLEPSHKRRGGSISRLAYEIGLPRTIVDIRHESSHRHLPSLSRVRIAVVEAIDWLKQNYWEPQKNMIPDVRDEVRSRLREITYYLKTKNAQVDSERRRVKRSAILMASNKLSSRITAKLQSSKHSGPEKYNFKFEKFLSKLVKIVARLYSTYPSEVVSVLLEFFQLQASEFSETADVEQSGKMDASEAVSREGFVDSLKIIISRISSKRPSLLLSILKNVLDMIETNIHNKLGAYGIISSTDQTEAHVRDLCSFVHWLILNIKTLKDSGCIGFTDKSGVTLTEKNIEPKFSLVLLLQKCLAVSVLGDKHLLDSVVLLIKMMQEKAVKDRLMKLPHLSHNWDIAEGPTYSNMESVFSQEEDMIKTAIEGFENVRLKLKARRNINTGRNYGTDETGDSWTVAKSWIPCPIGMLPCFLSSNSVLPLLDNVSGDTKSNAEMNNDKSRDHRACNVNMLGDHPDPSEDPRDHPDSDENVLDYNTEPSEYETPTKRLKPTMDGDGETIHHSEMHPVKSHLLIGGVWEKVSEEDLPVVGASIRIIEQL